MRSILICLLLSLSGATQSLTIANLIDVANRIPKPYNESTASASNIDNIALNFVAQGYVLSNFYDTTTMISGNRLKAKSYHLLYSISNLGTEDKTIIVTTMNDGSGYAASCQITFSTNNFSTYQRWLSDVRNLSAYPITNLSSLGMYIFRNSQSRKLITAGLVGQTQLSNGAGGNSTQYWRATEPITYYCTISYN